MLFLYFCIWHIIEQDFATCQLILGTLFSSKCFIEIPSGAIRIFFIKRPSKVHWVCITYIGISTEIYGQVVLKSHPLHGENLYLHRENSKYMLSRVLIGKDQSRQKLKNQWYFWKYRVVWENICQVTSYHACKNSALILSVCLSTYLDQFVSGYFLHGHIQFPNPL